MILLLCLLGSVYSIQAVELSPSTSSPFFSVPLLPGSDSEEKDQKNLVEVIPSCRAFKFALDEVAAGFAKEFILPNFVLGKDPKVLCAQTACEAPLCAFIKQFTTQDAMPLKVITFLAQAETMFFKNDPASLKRRHMALYYAVQKEHHRFVSELVKYGAPVQMVGGWDLLAELVANCRARMSARHHNIRSGSCYSMCSGSSGTQEQSEDSAHKIATLLIANGAPVAIAGEGASKTNCTGKACMLLRTYHKVSDPTDKKSRKKDGSKKTLSPDPSILSSSPRRGSSYLTSLFQNEDDEVSLSEHMSHATLQDEEELR